MQGDGGKRRLAAGAHHCGGWMDSPGEFPGSVSEGLTERLQVKHSNKTHFKLFGMDCIVKDGAAYLEHEGNLEGSLLTFEKAIQKMKQLQ